MVPSSVAAAIVTRKVCGKEVACGAIVSLPEDHPRAAPPSDQRGHERFANPAIGRTNHHAVRPAPERPAACTDYRGGFGGTSLSASALPGAPRRFTDGGSEDRGGDTDQRQAERENEHPSR